MIERWRGQVEGKGERESERGMRKRERANGRGGEEEGERERTTVPVSCVSHWTAGPVNYSGSVSCM